MPHWCHTRCGDMRPEKFPDLRQLHRHRPAPRGIDSPDSGDADALIGGAGGPRMADLWRSEVRSEKTSLGLKFGVYLLINIYLIVNTVTKMAKTAKSNMGIPAHGRKQNRNTIAACPRCGKELRQDNLKRHMDGCRPPIDKVESQG